MRNIIKKNGFTLIELLVVISIIAVLMAIMMPALRKAKEQALAVIDASQHKDIGLAMNLYTQDWKGMYPRAYWDETVKGSNYTRLPYKLQPYYDFKVTTSFTWDYELFVCPGQPKDLWDTTNNKVVERGKGAVGSYGYNIYFFYGVAPYKGAPQKEYVERRASDIRDGANLPLQACISGERYEGIGGGGGQVLKYEGPHPKAFKYGYMGGKSPASISKTSYTGPAPNHGKNCNMLMADFSVRPVNVCEEGQFPWQDHAGTMFHPSRASTRGFETR